jgi:hypothetical protein
MAGSVQRAGRGSQVEPGRLFAAMNVNMSPDQAALFVGVLRYHNERL